MGSWNGSSQLRKTTSEASVRNRGFLKRSIVTSEIAKRLPSRTIEKAQAIWLGLFL